MKRLFILPVLLVLVALGVNARPMAPAASQGASYDSLFYATNPTAMTAVVSGCEYLNKKNQRIAYPQPVLRIPATIIVTGFLQDPNRKDTLSVVAIAEKAFVKAKATSVVFDAPSNVASIGTLAFSSMANMTGKLTLPASLEHLDVSSILLPGITEIEFLGEVPPTCDIAGGYNPWTSATEVTSADIKVTVPDGALSAYQDAEGIGDYFTCLKKEDPTSLQDNEIRSVSGSCKVWRGTQLLIEREGVLYNMVGSKVQ